LGAWPTGNVTDRTCRARHERTTQPPQRHRDRRVRRRLPSRSGRVRGGSRPGGLEQAREHYQRAPRGQGHQRGDGHSPRPVRRRGRRLRRTQAPGPCHPASPQTAAPITVRKFAPFRKHRKPCARLNRPGGGRGGIRLRWRPKRTIRAVERSWVFVNYGPPGAIGNRRLRSPLSPTAPAGHTAMRSSVTADGARCLWSWSLTITGISAMSAHLRAWLRCTRVQPARRP
jgi:hypothetical protein